MHHVNGPNDSVGGQYSTDLTSSDDAGIVGWVRWWHWLIVVTLCFAAFLYYPLWRFEQKWVQLRVGDPFDRVTELLGDPGKASYSMQGLGGSDNVEAFIYIRYWKTYEVLVSTASRRVTAKTVLEGSNSPVPPTSTKKL
jgi:hypothetical protein